MATLNAWLSLLDQAMAGEFPWWQNLSYTHGAMRATGLAHGPRRTLALETLVYAQREGEIQRTRYAFDPDHELAGYVSHHTLAAERDFIEVVDDLTIRSRVTGVVSASKKVRGGYSERMLIPPTGRATQFELNLGKKTYALPLELPPTEGFGVDREQWQRLRPEEVVLFQLVTQAKRSALSGTKTALKQQLGLPKGAKTSFTLDDWPHPADPEADSDLGAMCRALTTGKAPKLSKTPNGDWRHWVGQLLAARQDPSPWWGIGAEVLEAAAPPKATRPKTGKPAKVAAPSWLGNRNGPKWDAHGSPCAAMRASGFVAADGPALVIEAIVASHRLGDVRRETCGFGPGATKAPPHAVLTPTAEIVSAAQIHDGPDGTGKCRVARGELLAVTAMGRQLSIEMTLPTDDPKLAALADRALPAQVVAHRLVELVPPDELFGSEAELVELAGMRQARRLFTFEDWQPVKGSGPLSKSPDRVAMAGALEHEDPGVTLPGKPSGGWRAFAGRVLRGYGKREKDRWP